MKSIPLSFAIMFAMASTSAMADSHSGHDAHAAAPIPGMAHGMMGMDKMTPERHQKKMDEMFAQMDADNNGSVTKAEFNAHHAKMMAKHQEMMAKPHPKAESASEAEHKH